MVGWCGVGWVKVWVWVWGLGVLGFWVGVVALLRSSFLVLNC